jgi:hypothetical protein
MSIMLQNSIILLLAVPLANAFSFWFTGIPTQCANMTVQWTSGNAPYKLLLVPTGHVDPETRVILDQTIQSGNAYSFVLKYPADSSFVAVMSDNAGTGSGGTSAVTNVASSNDKSCLPTTPSSPEFFLFTNPSTPQQCAPMEISYNQGAQPPVDILGVIPAGETFEVAKGAPSNSSFDWTADVKGGTQMMLVAGDTKGAGTGGSTDLLSVQDGGDGSCLVADSPSSTAGNPVGGVSTAASSTQSGASQTSGSSSGASASSSGAQPAGSAGSPDGKTGVSGDPGSGAGTVTGPDGSPTGVLPVVTQCVLHTLSPSRFRWFTLPPAATRPRKHPSSSAPSSAPSRCSPLSPSPFSYLPADGVVTPPQTTTRNTAAQISFKHHPRSPGQPSRIPPAEIPRSPLTPSHPSTMPSHSSLQIRLHYFKPKPRRSPENRTWSHGRQAGPGLPGSNSRATLLGPEAE